MAAAIQASVAAQQQLDTGRSEDREEAGTRGPEEARGSWRPTRTQGEGPGEPGPCEGQWVPPPPALRHPSLPEAMI